MLSSSPFSTLAHKKIVRHFVKGVFEGRMHYAFCIPLSGLLEASFSVDTMNFNSDQPIEIPVLQFFNYLAFGKWYDSLEP